MNAQPVAPSCPLCQGQPASAPPSGPDLENGNLVIHRGPRWRVLRALDTPAFPAFYRLVWTEHRAEFSELSHEERRDCMEAVAAIEAAMRSELHPDKINLASLGNMVPHLHWHLIARFRTDSHFPNPIWGERQREADPALAQQLAASLPRLDERLRAALAALT
ncbi:HIT family protein [Pelomonas sp. CA6]|uniref:HIT family protein n=1 Tax=Pelomonas sp. CA6 TaxID=2907999 RepID=UPI001F4C049E|nr:HIT family protein [Pelomonas sp. CA6]MCH7343692.1 HIT family protein [Pelomonas sp. CA6]